MKRYEHFNQLENAEHSPEEQAFGMIVTEIFENRDVEDDELGDERLRQYQSKFRCVIEWLNMEVSE